MKNLLLSTILIIFAGCGDDTTTLGIDDLEISASQCKDGLDNDEDGLTDCDDEDCQGFVFCVDGGGDADSDSDVDFVSDEEFLGPFLRCPRRAEGLEKCVRRLIAKIIQ